MDGSGAVVEKNVAASQAKFKSIPRLGLGLASLGRPGYINLGHAEDLAKGKDVSSMQSNAFEVLDAAWRLGIRYLDAARSYGKAEEFLSNWLSSRQIPPDEAVVGSKWGYYYTADWKIDAEFHEIKDHTISRLMDQWQSSSGLLSSHGLCLYQIHSATFESGVLDNRDVLEELVRIRQRHGVLIGLTLSGPRQADVLREAMAREALGEKVFNSVQATWNLLEQSAGPALQEAHASGMKVLIKEAVANGRLTSRNTSPHFQNKLKLLERTAHDLNTTVDAVALAAVLAQPYVDIVLSGASTVEQLESNVNSLSVSLPSESLQSLQQSLVQNPHTYWKERSALSWN